MDPENDLIDSVIVRCVERKCAVVSQDPLEQGQFRFFNYGHEIGHAVEVAYDYQHLRHGEAVAIGMHAAAWMGVEAGLTDPALFARQGVLLSALGLPLVIPVLLRQRWRTEHLAKRIDELLLKDKKRTSAGSVWIIPQHLGEAIATNQISAALVTRCVERVAQGLAD